MRSVFSARLWTPVTCAALIVGCSSPAVRLSPQPNVSIGPTTAPTGGTGATATPTPAPGHTATPTPAPVHSAVPTPVPTSTATGGETGNIATYVCPAPVAAVPGNSFFIQTEGIVSGSAYAQDPAYASNGFGWEYDSTTLASPTPVPTITPVPTATPTEGPTASPVPYVYNVYEGTYSLAAFGGTAIPSGGTVAEPYSVPAQSGCMILVQEVSGPSTIVAPESVLLRPVRAAATPNPADNAVGEGDTSEATDNYDSSEVASGAVTSFELSGISVPDGAGGGAFALDAGGTGTVSIQASGTVTITSNGDSTDVARRLRAKIAGFKTHYRDFRR